jgi:hypothetical protein
MLYHCFVYNYLYLLSVSRIIIEEFCGASSGFTGTISGGKTSCAKDMETSPVAAHLYNSLMLDASRSKPPG